MLQKISFLVFILIFISQSNSQPAIQNKQQKNTSTLVTDSTEITITKNDSILMCGEGILFKSEIFNHKREFAFRGIENMASIFPGVSKLDNSSLLNIRGGLNWQTKISMDGMVMNNPFDNGMNIYLPNEVIENIYINTNSIDINKEYTDQIMITLPERFDKYYGFVKAISDGFLSSKNKTLGTYSYGYNEYIMAVGGPIIPNENHSFFLSASRRWLQEYKPSWGWAENDNKPDDLDESVIPGNTNSEWSVIAKAKYNITENMNVIGNFFSTDRTYSDMNPLYLYNTEHASTWATNHKSYRLSWNHKIIPQLSYQIGYKYLNVFRENYDRFFGDDLLAYGNPNYNPLDVLDDSNWGIAYNGRYVPDLYQPGAQYNNYYKNKTTYYGIDFDITYQLNEHHKLKAGFEYKKHTLREFHMYNPVALAIKSSLTLLERYRLADVRFYGYDLQGNEVDDGTYFDIIRDGSLNPISGFDKQAPYEPIVMNASLQDNIEYGDFDLKLALQYDRIDPNAWQFKYLEVKQDNNGNPIPNTGMFGDNEIFDESDIEDSDLHEFISPRISAIFNVDQDFSLYANYGKYIHSANWSNLYLNPFFLDSWVNRGGYFTTINNPNMEPGKTISYEFGTKVYLKQNIFLKTSLYYREIYDLPMHIPIQTDVTEIAFLQNGEEYSAKGFDINLIFEPNANFFMDINFGMLYKNDFGYSSASNFDIAWQTGNYPAINVPPREFEKQYSGSINLSYSLKENQGPILFDIYPFENLNLNLLASFYSGRPYYKIETGSTLPFSGRYDNDGLSAIPFIKNTTEFTPSVLRFDLKISKKFNLPLNTYLKTSISVLNLFNSEIINDVWITTGRPDETGYLNTQNGQEYFASLNENEKKNYIMREMDFNHYGNPRQIRLELELGF